MRKTATLLILTILTLTACIHADKRTTKETVMPEDKDKATSICSDDCNAKNKSVELKCKLTTPELRQRKETVIASLKQQVVEKKERTNGFAFKFPGTDKVLDELTEFIKTERTCCDFFTFNLSISGDKSEAWLELTGVDGVKDFIISELGL